MKNWATDYTKIPRSHATGPTFKTTSARAEKFLKFRPSCKIKAGKVGHTRGGSTWYSKDGRMRTKKKKMRAEDASAAKCSANVLVRVRCRRTGAWFPNDACPNAYPKPETCPAYGGTQSTHACWSGGHSMQPFSSSPSYLLIISCTSPSFDYCQHPLPSTVAIHFYTLLSILHPLQCGKVSGKSERQTRSMRTGDSTLPLFNPS